jgi:multidrug efflux pump subunit AcrA (membrane-fusion protein)
MKPQPLLTLMTALAALSGCASDAGEDPAPEAQTALDPKGPGIELSSTIRRNLGVTFAKVEVRRVANTMRIPGTFEFTPLARREYRLPLAGRVELLVDENDPVEPGQPLFRFQSPTWPELLHEIILGEQEMARTEVQIQVDEAKLEEARSNLDTVRSRIRALADLDLAQAGLVADAATIEASLPRLEAQLQLARIGLDNARRTRQHALHRAATAAGLTEADLLAPVDGPDGSSIPGYEAIDWIEVSADRAGVVESLDLTDGAFAQAPARVLTTVNPKALRLHAMALQADLPELEGLTQAMIVPPRSPGLALEEGIAALVQLSLEAHPAERTLVVLAEPAEHPPWVRNGVSAFLEIVTGDASANALAIPASAIVRDGLEHVFFRRDPSNPNRVLRVVADMGVSDGRWTVLQSGVQRGEEVVLAGAYELNLAASGQDKSSAGGHAHADGTTHSNH